MCILFFEDEHRIPAYIKRRFKESGYDPDFGASPLKRTIQRELQDPLALKILSGEFHEGETNKVDCGGEELTFTADMPVIEGEVVSE